jgi:hypothetical protein
MSPSVLAPRPGASGGNEGVRLGPAALAHRVESQLACDRRAGVHRSEKLSGTLRAIESVAR